MLQIRSVEFAGKYKVKLRVLSSFTDVDSTDMGTLITFEEDENMEQAIISGIAFNRDEAKITVLGVPDRPGIAFSILGPIADANIDVDMIIQNVAHDGLTDFSFTVHRNEFKRAMQILEDQVKPRDQARASVTGDDRIAKVSLVGIGMRTHAGIASQDVRRARRRGHQHPDDLDLRDQDLGGDRREVHGARGARAAPHLRARQGADRGEDEAVKRLALGAC